MNAENSYRTAKPVLKKSQQLLQQQRRAPQQARPPQPQRRPPAPVAATNYDYDNVVNINSAPINVVPNSRDTRIETRQDKTRQDIMQTMQARYSNMVGGNRDFKQRLPPTPINDDDEYARETKETREAMPNSILSTPLARYDPDPSPESDDEQKMILHQDTTSIADQAFPFVYADNPFYQLPQSNLIVNPVPAYLTIDSRDRDRTVYPNTNQYKIPLVSSDNDLNIKSPNVRYKNIYSISLLSCVIPNLQNVLHESYLLLQIDEIDHVYDSASPSCARAFTKLYFKDVSIHSKYLRLDKGVGDPLTKIYWPAPRASLDSITLSFRHPDGTLFDFGPDAPFPADPLPDRQTSITLEIRTFVVDSGKALGHRNI